MTQQKFLIEKEYMDWIGSDFQQIDDILIFGRSLGGAVAARLAAVIRSSCISACGGHCNEDSADKFGSKTAWLMPGIIRHNNSNHDCN